MLAVLIAVAVVAAMRVVGILLIAAMMVLPVASGQLLARSFRGDAPVERRRSASPRWSSGSAASRFWGLAPGGTIVLVAAAVFAVRRARQARRGSRASRHGSRTAL